MIRSAAPGTISLYLCRISGGGRGPENVREICAATLTSRACLSSFSSGLTRLCLTAPLWRTARTAKNPSLEGRRIQKPLLHVECPVQRRASRPVMLYSQPQLHFGWYCTSQKDSIDPRGELHRKQKKDRQRGNQMYSCYAWCPKTTKC